MKTESPLHPDFPALNFVKSDSLSDIYIVAVYYIIITPEIISDFHQ
jgi:hypothetical protein